MTLFRFCTISMMRRQISNDPLDNPSEGLIFGADLGESVNICITVVVNFKDHSNFRLIEKDCYCQHIPHGVSLRLITCKILSYLIFFVMLTVVDFLCSVPPYESVRVFAIWDDWSNHPNLFPINTL